MFKTENLNPNKPAVFPIDPIKDVTWDQVIESAERYSEVRQPDQRMKGFTNLKNCKPLMNLFPESIQKIYNTFSENFPEDKTNMYVLISVSKYAQSWDWHRDDVDLLHITPIGKTQWYIKNDEPLVQNNRVAVWIPAGHEHKVHPLSSRVSFVFSREKNV